MLQIDAGASTTDATSGWKCTQQTKTAKNLRVGNIAESDMFQIDTVASTNDASNCARPDAAE